MRAELFTLPLADDHNGIESVSLQRIVQRLHRRLVVGMLSFREVIQATVKNGGTFGTTTVYRAMDSGPLICTLETELDEVRRMMLERHARYMPVIDNRMLMGVISFYDVARAVVDSQNFENKMLKAYIRDWPEGEDAAAKAD